MDNAALITATAALLAALIGVWSQAFFQARAARLAILERRLSVLERYTRAMAFTLDVNTVLEKIYPQSAMAMLPQAQAEADGLFESATLALHLFGDDVLRHFVVLQEEMRANVWMLERAGRTEEEEAATLGLDLGGRHERLQRMLREAQTTFGEYVARDRHAGLSWRRRIEIRSDAAVQKRDAHLRPQSPYRAGSAT